MYRLLLVAIGTIPALLPLVLIVRFGTNVPYLDQWFPDLAGIYVKAQRHQLSIWDFTLQHNEHRILLPRLIYFMLNSVTHLNTIVEMCIGWGVVAITSVGILRLLQRTLPGSGEEVITRPRSLLRLRVPSMWFVCNVILFTPAQAENWLWGLGLIIFLPPMFLLAVLLVVSHPRLSYRIKTVLAIVICSAATYTYGNGIILWPLTAIALLFSPAPIQKTRLVAVAILIGACAVNMVFYFIHYIKPSHGGIDAYAASLMQIGHFFIVFLGNPFAATTKSGAISIATITGSISFGLFVVGLAYFIYSWRVRRDYRICARMLLWLLIGAYAIFSAGLASVTRTGFGLNQALASRYVTFSIYLVIALIPIMAIILEDISARARSLATACKVAGSAFCALVIAGQVIAIPNSIAFCKLWQHSREEDHAAVLMMAILPDNPQITHAIPPDPPGSIAHALLLDEIGYLHPRLIRDTNAAKIEISPSFADGALMRTWQPEPGYLMCAGWATLPARHKAADSVFLTCENDRGEPIIIAAAMMGAYWEGVIPSFDDPYYRWAGWVARIPTDRLGVTNNARLQAWVFDSNSSTACRLQGSTEIRR